MNGWKEIPLKDVTLKITKGTTPSTLGGKFLKSGINFIKSEAISYDGRIDKSTFCYIDEETHNQLKRSQLLRDDILFSMAGIFLGKNALITEDLLPANTNQALAIIRLNQEKVVPKFVNYFLRQRTVIEHVNNMSGQSAQPNINFEEIGSIGILIPSIEEQHSIVEVLASFDDKIDFLHRQNKTLEQLSETIFRQWFVEEAEDNWNDCLLSEFAVHLKQTVTPSKNPETIFIHYSLPAYDEGKEPKNEIGKDILSGKYRVVSNSILISKLNPGTPRVWSLYGEIEEGNSICSTEFQVVQPKDQVWFGFIYYFLKSFQVAQELKGSASGTSGSHQRVSPQDIFNLSFKKPPRDMVESFADFTGDAFRKINNNTRQIRTLTQLRDTLLPKLMSGEVRVRYLK